MSSKSKVKGNGFEREIVKLATSKGLDCSRSWGSDGRSRGLHKDVDIVLENYNVQCKRIKRLPKWLGLTPEISIVLTRADHGETFAIVRLDGTDGLLELLLKASREGKILNEETGRYESLEDDSI